MNVVDIAIAKKYTKNTASQFGAVQGAPCKVSNTTYDASGNTVVTLQWTNDSGVSKTTNVTIKKGDKGDKGEQGVSVVSGTIDSNDHLILNLSNGTTIDSGVMPQEKVNVSKDSGNALVQKTDGLYVATTGVQISSKANNIIQQETDGLYAKADEINISTKTDNIIKKESDGSLYVPKTDLDNYVEKENGKSLSTNDLTDALKAQYDKAEENVQSDWNQTDNSKDDFIKNKPTILKVSTDADNAIKNGSDGGIFVDKADSQVQSDWNQTDSSKIDYIKNKPTVYEISKDSNNALKEGSDKQLFVDKQVQSDWTETDSSKLSFIKNKPTVYGISTDNNNAIKKGTDNELFVEKVDSQIQADWTQTDNTKVDFIKNKPTIDQTYNSTSENAQSGKAVSSGIATELGKLTYLTKEIIDKDTLNSYIADTTKSSFNVIYLVKDETAVGLDKYYEYQRLGDASSSTFECTGDTSTDLTDYAKKTYVDGKIGNILQLGFDGVLENKVITFTHSTEYEIKSNYEYEVDLNLALVGQLDDDVQLVIKNGEENISFISPTHRDSSTYATVGEMKQLMRYSTVSGFRWLFKAICHVTSNDIKVLLVMPVIVNLAEQSNQVLNVITNQEMLDIEIDSETLYRGRKVNVNDLFICADDNGYMIGHVYRYTGVDGAEWEDISNDIITTSFNSTLSDTKVPSEKLVKTELDKKVNVISGKGLSTVDFTDTNYVHTDNNYDNSAVAEVAKVKDKFDSSNIVTSFGTTPSDSKVASEKLVKDSLDDKADKAIEKIVSENWSGNGYNLIPFPYPCDNNYSYASSFTVYGVTTTQTPDGKIHSVGTLSKALNGYFFRVSNRKESNPIQLENKKYMVILNKTYAEESVSNVALQVVLYKNQEAVSTTYNTKNKLIDNTGGLYDSVFFGVWFNSGGESGQVIDTTFQPMLVEVNEDGTYPTEYQRYASGNVELTDKFESKADKSELDNQTELGFLSGKNLLDGSKAKYVYDKCLNNDGELIDTTDGTGYYEEPFMMVEPNTVYTISCKTKNGATGRIYFYDADKNWLSRTQYVVDLYGTDNKNFTTVDNCKYIKLQLNKSCVPYTNEIQIEKGNSITSYEPYVKSNTELSKVCNDDLKMLGWTVPAECPIQNYTDANGVFHQRVGRVDLGSLSWDYVTRYTKKFFVSKINDRKPTYCSGYCYKYKHGEDNYFSTFGEVGENNTFIFNTYGGDSISKIEIAIMNDSYTDIASFKSAMNGVYLYYELATEVTKKVDGNEVTENIVSTMNKQLQRKAVIGDYGDTFIFDLHSTYRKSYICVNSVQSGDYNVSHIFVNGETVYVAKIIGIFDITATVEDGKLKVVQGYKNGWGNAFLIG